MSKLKMQQTQTDLADWKDFVSRVLQAPDVVKVACVGKYTHLADSYISHMEAFNHAGAEAGAKVDVIFVDSEEIEAKGIMNDLKSADALLIPGGFGHRGIEGKILAARYARENGIPFLGVCLGFQVATIEIARHVLGLEGAHSTEFDPETRHPVVDLLPEQRTVKKKGATMRLGSQPVIVSEDSHTNRLYGKSLITERHRHRFEINPKFIDELEGAGWRFTGRSPDGIRMEVGEFQKHPYFIASQFHPEFKSRPGSPSPLHLGLIKAAIENR